MNAKSSWLFLEDGLNGFHNESLALSLLDICCSPSPSNVFQVLQRFLVEILRCFRGLIRLTSMILNFWSLWRLLSLIPIKLQVLEEWFKWTYLNVLHSFLRQNFSRVLAFWKLRVENESGCPLFIVVSENKFYFELICLKICSRLLINPNSS